MAIRRFLLFSGPEFEAGGGWHDFRGDYDTAEEAVSQGIDSHAPPHWWHVIDTHNRAVAASSDENRLKRTFAVWSEGYTTTGEYSGAIYLGEWPGGTFESAVRAFRDSLPEDERHLVSLHGEDPRIGVDDPPRFWGCRLFDNKTDAQERFS